MLNLPNFVVLLLPGVAEIAKEHHLAGQQHDNLCGPYWVSILLRSHGYSVTPEAIAASVGSVLPAGDPLTWLPKGGTPRQDYSFPLPTTASLSDAGTSVYGLIETVAQVSQGKYCLLPLQAQWTAERVTEVLHLCQTQPDWKAIPICNLRTGHLWGAGLAVEAAIAYLNSQPIAPPPPNWNVGHFLALAGTVQGKSRSLVLVCDTYPMFGWQGYHLQSAEAIAHALNRDDGNGGGILLFVATQHQAQVQSAFGQNFTFQAWNNGSPNGKSSYAR